MWQKLQPVNHNSQFALTTSFLQEAVTGLAHVFVVQVPFFPFLTGQVLQPSKKSSQPPGTIGALFLISFGFSWQNSLPGVAQNTLVQSVAFPSVTLQVLHPSNQVPQFAIAILSSLYLISIGTLQNGLLKRVHLF